MHFVGIDWGNEHHQVAVMNAEGKVISEWRIRHDWTGFQRLHDQLSTLTDVKINIERSDGLLVDDLVHHGYAIFVTTPRITASQRPRSSKDDREDARILARLLRNDHPEVRPLIRHSSTVEALRQLVRALEQAQREEIRLGNRLREVLQAYYPTAIKLFSSVTTGIALAFIKAYPTPKQAKALTLAELETFLRRNRYNHMARLNILYQRLQKPTPEAAVTVGVQSQALGLVHMLQVVIRQVSQLKRELKRTFASHPESDWWASLPGAGELTAPRLLAWIGDNRDAYPTAEVLQAVAGTSPITRQSGKQRKVHFRWACHKPLRSAISDFAHNSVEHSGWAKSYLYSQLERGHFQHRAYRALANRWIRILWTLWQRREAYDEAKHVANRSQNGINTAA